MMPEGNFTNPQLLWLLLIIPVLAAWFIFTKKPRTALVTMPAVPAFSTKNTLSRLRPITLVLRLLALALIVLALARPQSSDMSTEKRGTEGIDIVMAVDISSSMLARDLKPNRLEALKKVAITFIEGRPTDRIGLVIYAGESFAQVPLTTDQNILKNAIADLKWDMLENGTAIGMGLATAVNRIKESDAISKVIILLTDGENNRGIIDPKTAAQLAQQHGIKVYTIGVGTKGYAETPVGLNPRGQFIYQKAPVNIDEDLLREIANMTNGQYFRATNNESLAAVYQEIDQLEKSELEELVFYKYQEHFYKYVFWALAFIAIEVLLRLTLFRSLV